MGRAEPCPYEIRGTRYNVFPLDTFAHWMKRHVSGRPCVVARQWETFHFNAILVGTFHLTN